MTHHTCPTWAHTLAHVAYWHERAAATYLTRSRIITADDVDRDPWETLTRYAETWSPADADQSAGLANTHPMDTVRTLAATLAAVDAGYVPEHPARAERADADARPAERPAWMVGAATATVSAPDPYEGVKASTTPVRSRKGRTTVEVKRHGVARIGGASAARHVPDRHRAMSPVPFHIGAANYAAATAARDLLDPRCKVRGWDLERITSDLYDLPMLGTDVRAWQQMSPANLVDVATAPRILGTRGETFGMATSDIYRARRITRWTTRTRVPRSNRHPRYDDRRHIVGATIHGERDTFTPRVVARLAGPVIRTDGDTVTAWHGHDVVTFTLTAATRGKRESRTTYTATVDDPTTAGVVIADAILALERGKRAVVDIPTVGALVTATLSVAGAYSATIRIGDRTWTRSGSRTAKNAIKRVTDVLAHA